MRTARLSGLSLGLVLAIGATTLNVPAAEAGSRGGRVFGAIAAGVVLGAIISESARSSTPPKRAYREESEPRKKTTRTTTTRPATVRTSTETRRTTSGSDSSASSSASIPRAELPGGEGTSSSMTPPPRAADVAPARRDETPSTPIVSEGGSNSKIPR